MPNRIIKESICKSAEIDNLSYFEEVLFYRLMVNCDDYGRFDGRTKIISAFCFPLKDIKEKDITVGIHHLCDQGLISLYEVDKKPYIQLSTWEKHQQIRSKRPKYPGMDDENANVLSCEGMCNHVISDDIMCNHIPSDDSKCPRNPIQSNPNPNPNPNLNPKGAFVKPSIAEIQDYCHERQNGINAEEFFDFYESKGWMIGSNRMKDWRACVRTWERKRKNETKGSTITVFDDWASALREVEDEQQGNNTDPDGHAGKLSELQSV